MGLYNDIENLNVKYKKAREEEQLKRIEEENKMKNLTIVDKINKINEVYKDDELIIEMLNDTINDASKYVDVVTRNEALIKTLRFRLEGYDFRVRVQELDELRRRTHNGLIANLKSLNRLLSTDKRKELLLFEGDINDRYQVADWAMDAVNNIFTNRRL
jgi:hypothetical protein